VKNHYAKIEYHGGQKAVFSPLSEREAKRIYNKAVRNMAVENVKRTSYGLIEGHVH
jgi:glucuronate isomerase